MDWILFICLILLFLLAAIIGFICGYYVSIIVYRNNHPAIAAIFLFITCIIIGNGTVIALYYIF